MGTRNIQDMGSGEIKARIAAGSDTILIPVGSCERHGNPFTPLGIDSLISLAVTERASARADVLHTPLMPFGYAPHHMGREGEGCGTVSLRVETYRRVIEDIGRSLIFHGFNRLIFVSFHSYNVVNAEEVMLGLRFRTGAFVAFYGGRESDAAAEILESPPDRLASDLEAAMAMALLGDTFDRDAFLAHGYSIAAPTWLGPGFSKRAGTGLAVALGEQKENIVVGMEDIDFVTPIRDDDEIASHADAERGRRLLDDLSEHLADFATAAAGVQVEVTNRDYSDRAR